VTETEAVAQAIIETQSSRFTQLYVIEKGIDNWVEAGNYAVKETWKVTTEQVLDSKSRGYNVHLVTKGKDKVL